MDGKPACVRKFARDLRINIWNEHLGLPTNSMILEDPVSDNTYKFISERAKINTDAFVAAFPGIPANKYPVYASQKEDIKNRKSDANAYKEINRIKGHLVDFPFVWLWSERTKAGPWDGSAPDYMYAKNTKASKNTKKKFIA